MLQILLTYFASVVIFFALDMVWLGLIAKNFYREKLGFIMSDKINWPAAIIFYLLYVAALQYFAVQPAIKEMNWQTALLSGALLGGICYATYDLTNMATIAKWPLIIVIIDIAWGMVLTASVAGFTWLVASKWIY